MTQFWWNFNRQVAMFHFAKWNALSMKTNWTDYQTCAFFVRPAHSHLLLLSIEFRFGHTQWNDMRNWPIAILWFRIFLMRNKPFGWTFSHCSCIFPLILFLIHSQAAETILNEQFIFTLEERERATLLSIKIALLSTKFCSQLTWFHLTFCKFSTLSLFCCCCWWQRQATNFHAK